MFTPVILADISPAIFVDSRMRLMFVSLLTKAMLSLCRMLAEKLDMTPEDAERWIVNLIRNARLDAKIDSEKVTLSITMLCPNFTTVPNCFLSFAKGHVVMGTQASSVYQQVMEKTKGLLFKCQVLDQNYEKKKKSGTSDNYSAKVRK